MHARTIWQPDSVQHLFDEQLDNFRSGVKKLFDRATHKPTWFGRALDKTGNTIKNHPIAAIGIAGITPVGVGYAMVRAMRD